MLSLRKVWLSVGLLLMSPFAYADYALNMPKGVTPISHDIHDLHMIIFYICVGIGVVVFSIMGYALIRHRKSRGVTPATFHESTKLEIAWAIVPFLILIAMAIPATKVLVDMEDSSEAKVNIKIVGYQWRWQYEYLDEGISYFSNLLTPQDQIQNEAPKDKWYLLEVDKPLVVPTNTKIRFLITSNDVIHSWWVPDLGVKKDAVPGFINESWAKIDKPGIYRGQCTELCGVNHGYMPVVVEAKTPEDYKKWLAEQNAGKEKAKAAATKTWTKADLMKTGKEGYNKYCAACHKADGTGMPPAFPGLKGSPMVLGPVKAHIDMVLHGKQGTAMQAFGGQLSDSEIAAIVTYERNAWGNDTDDLVQPSDVKQQRGEE